MTRTQQKWTKYKLQPMLACCLRLQCSWYLPRGTHKSGPQNLHCVVRVNTRAALPGHLSHLLSLAHRFTPGSSVNSSHILPLQKFSTLNIHFNKDSATACVNLLLGATEIMTFSLFLHDCNLCIEPVTNSFQSTYDPSSDCSRREQSYWKNNSFYILPQTAVTHVHVTLQTSLINVLTIRREALILDILTRWHC